MAHIKKLISQRTGKFSYRVHIRTPLKTITKTFKKKSDAVSYARKIEGNDDILGVLSNPVLEQTFSEAIKDYTPEGNDPEAKHRLDVFAEDLGHLKLCNIGEGHIEAVLNKLAKKLAPATVNRYQSGFGTFAKTISKKWHPHRDIDKQKEPPGRKDYLTIKQQQNLLSKAKIIDQDNEWSKLYLLILSALTTGCRRGELMALEWRDIQWTDRVAVIRAEDAGAQKTGYREVPLTPAVIEELNQHRKFSGLIFANDYDDGVAFEFSKQWYRARKESGIPKHFVFHSLRHTAASNLAKAGRSLFQIGVILGHKSAQTTLRYAHLIEREALHEITHDAMEHLR